ncbi:MAG TPA: DUF2491 family protein [Stellaceae bacterium]|nr:DUF2491 family protein [Stellaceae bacterium]
MLRPRLVDAARHRAPVLALVLAVAFAFAAAQPADARSRSSGGYFKPGASSSFGGSAYSSGSRSSGGYSKPSITGAPYAASPNSGGDRALSRSLSGTALRQFRAQENARFAAPASPLEPPPSSWSSFARDSSYGAYYARRDGWFSHLGWGVPPYAYLSRPSFGAWDALWLWWMLDTLSRPGHAAFFYDHADDPAYRDFRAEADRLARDNADLRAQLAKLDAEMAARQGQPRDPNFVPADTPPQVALAADNVVQPAAVATIPNPGLPWGPGIGIILAFGAGLAIWVAAHHRRPTLAMAGGAGLGGGASMGPFGALGNYVADKLHHRGGYDPRLFRIGMSFAADPAPFVLAQGATKVRPLTGDAGSGAVTIMGIGHLSQGPALLHRLYVAEDRFFQLHLDPLGQPDECRYFSKIDEVTPATPDEWGFWLDAGDGSIGLPEFQTKDGKVYQRAWAPGSERIAPVSCKETLETDRGTFTIGHEAMLYAAATGLAPPAPTQEYILVSADTEGQSGAVLIYAGIDINPAGLSLA